MSYKISTYINTKDLTKHKPESTRGESILLGRETPVHSDNLNSVSGFTAIHEVVVEDDVDCAWQLSCGSLFRHFLFADWWRMQSLYCEFILKRNVRGCKSIISIIIIIIDFLIKFLDSFVSCGLCIYVAMYITTIIIILLFNN